MNTTAAQNTRVLAIKSLAIIGFLVTLALCVWLVVEGIKRAPEAFSSLASIIESVRGEPTDELRLTVEQAVVNSGESFDVSWTNVKQRGSYDFSYVCTPGIAVEVMGEDSVPVPLSCTEEVNLPSSVHKLSLAITSDTARLIDVPLKVTFTGDERDVVLSSEASVTIANAEIPVSEEEPAATTTPGLSEEEPVATSTPEVKPAPLPAPKPVTTIVYPQSDPNGYVDLGVTTLGSGVIRNGVFTFTARYDRDLKNAIRFDIKNVGTKTSGTWTFKTLLPSGQIYESPVQLPLKPLEHVEFTLGFDLDTRKDLVTITNTVFTNGDKNSKNNSATWSVVVTD